MIRVFIADDHPVVRRGIKNIIKKTSDIRVAGEASDGRETLQKVSSKSFDVVLLDISLPDVNGLELIKMLRRERPLLPILILSMYPEEQYGVQSLREGASGYITKESAANEIVSAIRKVYSGGKYISSSLSETLALNLQKDHQRPIHEVLSDREYQVLCLIASGKKYKQIAEELSIRPRTVETFRSRILEKMQMKTNAELTRYAVKNRLI